MKIIVIGGGPAGLTAAIKSKNKNNEVILLEKNNKCGKKLSLTGNGKGNYFNDDFTINNYFSNDLNLLKNLITQENKEKLLSFFDSIGLIPNIKNGWYYPYSNKAISLKEALQQELRAKKVTVITEEEVQNIIKETSKFKIITSKNIYQADKVILASGGKSYPKTGSTGEGYLFAEKLGHTIHKVLPALTPLTGEAPYFKDWHGIRAEAKLSLYENDNLITIEQGEVQLTDYGISGICLFNLSGIISSGLDQNKKETIHIDFMPFLKENTPKTTLEFLESRSKLLKNRTLIELLEAFLNYKLAAIIIKESNLKKDQYFKSLSLAAKEKLIANLRDFKLSINGVKSFDKAQTNTGGVSLKEIDLNTMESKIEKNFFIIGDLLDAYGKCGGYNLSLAFLTGLLAGEKAQND